MSDKIQIPASIEEAVVALNGIDRLLTAKQWERAAIVAAFDPQELLAWGVNGLTTPETIRWYRLRWAEHGTPVKPGDMVTLPQAAWPLREDSRVPRTQVQSAESRQALFEQVLAEDPEAIAKATDRNPTMATRVAKAVMEAPLVRQSVERKLAVETTPKEREASDRWAPRARDWQQDLLTTVRLLQGLAKARASAEWAPDSTELALLYCLRLLLDQQETEAGVSPDLFKEIEQHLRVVEVA